MGTKATVLCVWPDVHFTDDEIEEVDGVRVKSKALFDAEMSVLDAGEWDYRMSAKDRAMQIYKLIRDGVIEEDEA